MRRLKIPILIGILAIAVFGLLWKNQNNSSDWSSDLFRLQSPESITAILLSSNDPGKGYVKFEQVKGRWYVSDGQNRYPADTQSLNDLLHWAMPRLRLKNPVPDASKETVTRELAQTGTKAVFYRGEQAVHTLYVGSPTPTQESTYMYAPDTERPCVIEIPGFTGYLTPYFHTDIQQWRSVYLVDVEVSDIQSIEVQYPQQAEAGFCIEQDPSSFSAQLRNRYQGEIMAEAQTGLLLGYLEMSKRLSREAGENAGINNNPQAKKEVLEGPVLAQITYRLKDKSTQTLTLYPMPVGGETYSLETRDGRPKMNETDLYWARHSSEPERLWVIQAVHLQNRLKRRQDFLNR
ncbi:MAG: DUF4340 domain-containing protein [Bacteroidia bacterium]